MMCNIITFGSALMKTYSLLQSGADLKMWTTPPHVLLAQAKQCIISHGLSFELMGKQMNADVMVGVGCGQR